MGRIKKLEGSLINQIAAGEVVIQPCSVIKECVENSFDAGATRVEVEFTGGGAEGIRISDNGMGIEKEDLELSITRHATSKIENVKDLYSVTSCGFRGEALSSISEVSEFEMISKHREAKEAFKLTKDESGENLIPASRDIGTTLNIKNLFYNVPVRRRFLKTERSESSQNLDTLRKLAISRPWIGLKVKNNQKLCFDLPEDQNLEERIRDLEIFEKDTKFIDLHREKEGVQIKGLICAPPRHFGNGQKIIIYVNNRPIKDRAIAQAVTNGFSSYIPERRFPGAIVFIKMDPESVDVNIHPTKSEVRFHNSDHLFRQVFAAVKESLSDKAQIMDAKETSTLVYKTSGMPKTIPMNRSYGLSNEGKARPFLETSAAEGQSHHQSFEGMSSEPQFMSFRPEQESEDDSAIFKSPEKTRAFQVLKRFIIFEHDDHLEIMDQHAIHERVLFNQLAHEEEGKQFTSQMLLIPTRIKFPEGLYEISTEILFEMKRMGYLIELCNNKELEVQGVPDFLSAEKGSAVLEGILNDLSEGVLPNKDDLRRDILHSAACRSAIKAGDELSSEELNNIIAAVQTMDIHQGCCPHGRNAIWKISIDEANSMFNR